MAGKILTDARIGALVPRKTAYDIRDGKLRGFGVRVTPAGRWVFPSSRTGGPRNADWLDGFWRDARVAAGIGDVRLHDLRHTHASIALRTGATMLAIGRLLGHADPQTALKYTHPADAMIDAAAETVGAVLGRA